MAVENARARAAAARLAVCGGGVLFFVMVSCVSSGSARPRPREATPARERLACLEAPWVVSGSDLPERWSVQRVTQRTFLLTYGDGRVLPREDFDALRSRAFDGLSHLRGFLMAGTRVLPESLGAGLGTGRDERQALWVSLDLCSTRLTEVVQRLGEVVGGGRVGERQRVDVLVEYSGALGPRCDANDPGCTAQAVRSGEDTDGPEEGGEREIVLPERGEGSCAHDGECSIGGCGNVCRSWRVAPRASTCIGFTALEDERVFCGCVSGQCRFFRD